MNVLFLPEVNEYLEYLVIILYKKEYFSFFDSSEKYVEELVDDIKENLPTKQRKPAPEYFSQYGTGMEYASFKKNKRTTWYVFFEIYEDTGEIIYLVRYIANNHTVAQYL